MNTETAPAYRPSEDCHVIASVSGGKDSAAMLLHLREIGVWPVRAVFFDTGWEHADTYAHVDYLADSLGIEIERHGCVADLPERMLADAEAVEAALGLNRPSAFARLCLKKGIFPRRTARFCTQSLKVFVVQDLVREMHKAGQVPVNTVGIRAAESVARSKLTETEISPTLDCMIWRPLIRWSEADVVDIHRRNGVKMNPLYARGAERVGCYPCIMGAKSELRMVGKDPQRMEAIRLLEAAVQKHYLARAEAKGETMERPPTLFTASRRDANGDRPGIGIDDVIAWAKTARGASVDQTTMFDDFEDPDAGCMRWGMCEQAPD